MNGAQGLVFRKTEMRGDAGDVAGGETEAFVEDALGVAAGETDIPGATGQDVFDEIGIRDRVAVEIGDGLGAAVGLGVETEMPTMTGGIVENFAAGLLQLLAALMENVDIVNARGLTEAQKPKQNITISFGGAQSEGVRGALLAVDAVELTVPHTHSRDEFVAGIKAYSPAHDGIGDVGLGGVNGLAIDGLARVIKLVNCHFAFPYYPARTGVRSLVRWARRYFWRLLINFGIFLEILARLGFATLESF